MLDSGQQIALEYSDMIDTRKLAVLSSMGVKNYALMCSDMVANYTPATPENLISRNVLEELAETSTFETTSKAS